MSAIDEYRQLMAQESLRGRLIIQDRVILELSTRLDEVKSWLDCVNQAYANHLNECHQAKQPKMPPAGPIRFGPVTNDGKAAPSDTKCSFCGTESEYRNLFEHNGVSICRSCIKAAAGGMREEPIPTPANDDALVDSIMTAIKNCPDVYEPHYESALRREIRDMLREKGEGL